MLLKCGNRAAAAWPWKAPSPLWLRLAVSMRPTRQSGPRQSLDLATGALLRAATPVRLAALELPEFLQEVCDHKDRELNQQTRVAVKTADGAVGTPVASRRVRANRSEERGGTRPSENKHTLRSAHGFGESRLSRSQCSVILTAGK